MEKRPMTRSNPDFTDTIQEECIRRMHELRLTPHDLAAKLRDKIHDKHTIHFLTRRASMLTCRAQFILRTLDLEVGPKQSKH